MSTFGSRLLTLRKNNNLTQKDLADNLSINRSSISKYEKDILLPDCKLLKSLAVFFNVSADYILGISDIKKDLAFEKLSEHEQCGLILAESLYDSGFEINKNDVKDLELVCSIILQYTKNQKKEISITSLGNKLKKLRKNNNLTQKDLSNHFSIVCSTISKYEKDILLPDCNLLISFASYFNVSVDYLLGISDLKNNLDLQNISEYKKYSLLIFQDLHNSGLEIKKNDLKSLELVCTIFLQYKKHRND